MAEIIYTRVNPYEFIGQQIDLVKSIKQDGIKYPVLAHSNNRILNQSTFDYGNQRMLIALSLGLDEVPACGTNDEIMSFHGLDSQSIAAKIKSVMI